MKPDSLLRSCDPSFPFPSGTLSAFFCCEKKSTVDQKFQCPPPPQCSPGCGSYEPGLRGQSLLGHHRLVLLGWTGCTRIWSHLGHGLKSRLCQVVSLPIRGPMTWLGWWGWESACKHLCFLFPFICLPMMPKQVAPLRPGVIHIGWDLESDYSGGILPQRPRSGSIYSSTSVTLCSRDKTSGWNVVLSQRHVLPVLAGIVYSSYPNSYTIHNLKLLRVMEGRRDGYKVETLGSTGVHGIQVRCSHTLCGVWSREQRMLERVMGSENEKLEVIFHSDSKS